MTYFVLQVQCLVLFNIYSMGQRGSELAAVYWSTFAVQGCFLCFVTVDVLVGAGGLWQSREQELYDNLCAPWPPWF